MELDSEEDVAMVSVPTEWRLHPDDLLLKDVVVPQVTTAEWVNALQDPMLGSAAEGESLTEEQKLRLSSLLRMPVLEGWKHARVTSDCPYDFTQEHGGMDAFGIDGAGPRPGSLGDINLVLEGESTRYVCGSRVDAGARPLVSVNVLRAKANNPAELEPKAFSQEEELLFAEAKKKEWESWLANDVVEFVDGHVDPSCVINTPCRWVLVNKAAPGEKPIPKARLVVPGHQDPQVGLYRTDAPTANPTLIKIGLQIAASKDWKTTTFDVSTAFLQGVKAPREVYARAPLDGLPATASGRALKPRQLFRLLKAPYGVGRGSAPLVPEVPGSPHR